MPTRAPSRHVLCIAVLVLLCALVLPGAAWAQAWAQPPGVVAEGTADGRARLIVDNAGGTGPIAVTVNGQPRPIISTPILSDRLVGCQKSTTASDQRFQAAASY
jgi:hypothetical protein